MKEINTDEVTEARQSWSYRGRTAYPVFYAKLDGERMKRISLEEGLRLVDAGVLPMTDELKKYVNAYYTKAL